MILFFFNDTATTEIYTLSLHDALPISDGPRGAGSDAVARRIRRTRPQRLCRAEQAAGPRAGAAGPARRPRDALDRKSTRLNSSHANISYAVFCLKKKNNV